MLASYYKNRDALAVIVPSLRAGKKVRGFLGNKGVPLTAAEVETVGYLVKLLQPCKDITNVLQGTKYVTASHAGPMVRSCGARAAAVHDSLPAGSPVKPVAAALATAINDRFKATHKYEIIAMMLDPRFKRPVDDYLAPAWEELGKHFGLELSLVEREREADQRQKEEKEKAEKEQAEKEKAAKAKAKPASGKDEKAPSPPSSSAASSSTTTTSFVPRIEDLVVIYGLGHLGAEEKKKKDLTKELTDYLAEEVPDIRTDPLQWWRTTGLKKFPIMARLARKFLCLQATSVASERVWSTAGNVLTARRSTLHPKNLEALVLIHENYRSLKQMHEKDPKLTADVHAELMKQNADMADEKSEQKS